jgi:RNA polymerase primary sigma factor
MTGGALAEAVEVTPGAVSQWTSGKKTPRRETAERIAAALDLDLSWLEYGHGTGPTADLEAERGAYAAETGWAFRPLPTDGGMDFGNANVWVFDPNLENFTREVLQNVLDVVRGQSAHVTFRLIHLSGPRLELFKDALRWGKLEQHLVASASEGQKFGRSVADGLQRLRDSEKLLLLRIEEHGTSGLVGAEFGKQSNFTALTRNNLDSQKASATAGGAFGLGKAVLWRTSSVSTVLFNSDLAVPEGGHQEGRLIGRAELSFHHSEGDDFAGPGWFGQIVDDHAESYWGNRALAQDLCLERSPGTPGTSTLVLGFHDPTAEADVPDEELADELVRATAAHFWPALHAGRLEITVEVSNGPEDHDLVRSTKVAPHNQLSEFVEMLEAHEENDVAETLESEGDVARRSIRLGVPARKDGSHGELEQEAVLLVRRAAEDEDTGSTPNRVAFFRGTGMVVEYRDMSNIRVGARPFHAAVLCGKGAGDQPTDEAAEEFLRLAEPPAHNRWERTPDLAAMYARGSRARLDAMYAQVRDEIRELVGPAARDLSDGPRGLKELLRITGKSDEPSRPRITKANGKVDDEGRWQVRATITVKPDSKVRWKGRPVVIFDAETGGGTRVSWESLEAGKNCSVEDGDVLVLTPGKRQAEFTGVTDPESHPVSASSAAINVDFRAAERIEEGVE